MKKKGTFQFYGLFAIWIVFIAVALVLFQERSGITYKITSKNSCYLSAEQAVTKEMAFQNLEKECLFIIDSRDFASTMAKGQFDQIFKDMKIGYQTVDMAREDLPELSDFRTAVVDLRNLEVLGKDIITLSDWVYEGGRVLFPLTIEKERYSSLIKQKLGIVESSYENSVVDSIYLAQGFMLGGGESYKIVDPYDSAWVVQLGDLAKVHAWTDDDRKLPLVWENSYGKGKFVVDNFGICVKETRGFFAASYSLLEDVCAYPVINGAAFYLDDFPSPVPSGDGTYIRRDYQTSISDFYTNIWWPDMISLANRYGIRYTGVAIENYEDRTDGTVKAQENVTRFQYFGNMLLRSGGEIGYHGYNHQPLVLENTDYGDVLPYHTWKDREAMKAAMKELVRFEKHLYPGVEKSVYVPPSNILSKEGRDLLAEEFPHIRTIASNYFPGEFAYEQEFEVAKDGIVEQPRVISGAVFNDYMKLAALSELNMHMVSNHFMHPDDLLDEDRGAKLGWETLRERLEQYMNWLFSSASGIRRMTGSELSGAIQRYCSLTPKREMQDGSYVLKLDHFYDEGWFLVRFNNGIPKQISGGQLSLLEGNLYLLKAEELVVTIEME